MKNQLCFLFILAMSCLLLGGCEIIGTEDGISLEKGSFSVQVRGYINRSFQGEAVFETLYGLAGEPYFFLVLKDIGEPGENYRIVEFVQSHHGRPYVGTYNLANLEKPEEEDQDKFMGRYNDSECYGAFKSTGGTLTIHSANDYLLRGTFNFSAYELVPEEGGEYKKLEVRITGGLYAEKGDTGIILN